jgi:hypothetical protein
VGFSTEHYEWQLPDDERRLLAAVLAVGDALMLAQLEWLMTQRGLTKVEEESVEFAGDTTTADVIAAIEAGGTGARRLADWALARIVANALEPNLDDASAQSPETLRAYAFADLPQLPSWFSETALALALSPGVDDLLRRLRPARPEDVDPPYEPGS